MGKRRGPPSPQGSGCESSEDDEEERAKLDAAVDPFFTLPSSSQEGNNGPTFVMKKEKKSVRKQLENREEDFPKPYSLDVTPEAQTFIAKKLSKALDKVIEEVDMAARKSGKDDEVDEGIFLFHASSVKVTSEDIKLAGQSLRGKHKKPKLRKKRHVDGSESEEEDEKVRAVAVSASWVKNSLY